MRQYRLDATHGPKVLLSQTYPGTCRLVTSRLSTPQSQASPSASAVQFPLTHQALDDLDQFEINRPPSPGQVLELLSDGVGTSPWGLEAGAVADPGKPDEALGDLVPMARPIHTPTRSADGSAHHQTSSGEDASNMSRYQQSSPASQQDGAAAADEDEAKRAVSGGRMAPGMGWRGKGRGARRAHC